MRAEPRVSVLISDGGDPRIERTLASLQRQTLAPHEVLTERRGTVAESRNLMFRRAEGDVLAFIDTDERAPPDWLASLVAPIAKGEVDYTCGPTVPDPEAVNGSRYSAYLSELERRHYAMCAVDQTIFPMGNSAWSARVFVSLAQNADYAPFDERFRTGGEDYDVNLRATRLGYRGSFVPGAWVFHDQSNVNTAFRIMRRKLRYCYGGALAYLKNGGLKDRIRRDPPPMPPVLHWLEAFQKVAQIAGLVVAYVDWKRTEADDG